MSGRPRLSGQFHCDGDTRPRHSEKDHPGVSIGLHPTSRPLPCPHLPSVNGCLLLDKKAQQSFVVPFRYSVLSATVISPC